MTTRSLRALLRDQAVASPSRTAIVHLPSGRVVTWHDLHDVAERAIAVLHELGVRPRDRVVFLVRNHWLVQPLLAACAARGAVFVPVDPELHRDELATVVADAAPSLIVHRDDVAAPRCEGARALGLTGLLEALAAAVAPPPPTSRAHGAADAAEAAPDDDDDVASDTMALLIYTSGTTGANKAVMLSARNLVANAEALARRYEVTASDRFLCFLPTHHMNAILITGVIPIVAGASVVLDDVFTFRTAKHTWELVERHGVTLCSMVPSIMAMLLKLFPSGRPASSTLRAVFCGAAPLPDTTWRAFETTFSIPVHQGYGLTETTCWAVSTLPSRRGGHDNVGVPLDCCAVRIEPAGDGGAALDAHLFAANGAVASADDAATARRSGEVWIRGPIVSAGYFRNAALTKASRTDDGWFRTGDLGFFDDDGRLHVTGRLKEIIIRNGVNIFSPVVDQVVCSHPDIDAAKTIGLRDDLVGERVACCVVLRAGAAVDEAGLRAWVQQRLSRSSWPDVYEFVGALPRGPSGKITTMTLRRIVTGELADELFRALGHRSFKRAAPTEPDKIRARLQRSLRRAEPIPFLTYWGCGTRDSIADVDIVALRRLRAFIDGVCRVADSPPALTLLFTDTHTRNNGIPDERASRYFDAVAAVASSLGFSTARLGACIPPGLLQDVDAEVATPASLEAWRGHPLRGRLVEQARRHVEGDIDVESAAHRYLVLCAHEGRALVERFSDHLFLSYNPPAMDLCTPPLPTLHLYSMRAKTSVKPWFTS